VNTAKHAHASLVHHQTKLSVLQMTSQLMIIVDKLIVRNDGFIEDMTALHHLSIDAVSQTVLS